MIFLLFTEICGNVIPSYCQTKTDIANKAKLLSLAEKKNRVGDFFFFFFFGFVFFFFYLATFFFILQLSEFGFLRIIICDIFVLTVLNTLSTVIDIIPFGSRGRQNFHDILSFPIKKFRVGVKK
jgi:hypothetical protein